MALNKKDIDNILNLDDKEFGAKLKSAIEAMGVDKSMSGKILGDVGKVKKTLGSLSQNDIDRLTQNVDQSKISKINEIISDKKS